MTTVNPLSQFAAASVEAAARLTRISMDSAERTIAIQLEYAKGAVKQATLTAQAYAQVKDVNQLVGLRARIAENALENTMGYSRSLYEVASEAPKAATRPRNRPPPAATWSQPRSSPRSPRPPPRSTRSTRPRATWRATPTRASAPRVPGRRSNRADSLLLLYRK